MDEENDLAIMALLEFLNAAEVGIAAAKRLICEVKGVEMWSPSKIRWEAAEGSAGAYERSEDVNNAEFKKMIRDLQAHGGKMVHDGFFYWTFRNGSIVGRKQRKAG